MKKDVADALPVEVVDPGFFGEPEKVIPQVVEEPVPAPSLDNAKLFDAGELQKVLDGDRLVGVFNSVILDLEGLDERHHEFAKFLVCQSVKEGGAVFVKTKGGKTDPDFPGYVVIRK